MPFKSKMGWLRHVLTFLSVIIFILGCSVIGYIAWVLASSVTVTTFLNGHLIFTYTVISMGFILFFSGLIGWVGGASESPCLVKLFLLCVLISIVAEIGGLICLNVVKTEFHDIIRSGWSEINQGTRNIIQRQLNCCGWEGPIDFAYSNEPIDKSCYEDDKILGQEITDESSNNNIWPSRAVEKADDGISSSTPTKRMKEEGCSGKLFSWFEDNKITWVTILAAIVALQVMCCGIAIYILSRVRKLQKLSKARTISKRHLYEASSEDSRDYRNRF